MAVKKRKNSYYNNNNNNNNIIIMIIIITIIKSLTKNELGTEKKWALLVPVIPSLNIIVTPLYFITSHQAWILTISAWLRHQTE